MARRKKYRSGIQAYLLSSASNATTISNGFLNSRVPSTNLTVAQMSRMFDELLGTYVPSFSFRQMMQEAAESLDESLETFL